MIKEPEIKCIYTELVNPSTLKNHPKNRNKHGQDQIERLAKLYSSLGVRHPIIVSNLSKCIVSGHARKLAAIRAGIKVFPVVYQDFESIEQEYAFLQSDNAIALWAELDLSGINADILDLGPDFDIDLLGIEGFTLDPAEKEHGCDEDEVPEPTKTKAKFGDLFRLGNHRLLCGDSTDSSMVSTLVGKERMDMVFTDPPYGVDYDGGAFFKREKLKNDHDETIYAKVLPLLSMFSADHAAFFIWYAQSFSAAVSAAVSAAGLTERKCIIWNKNQAQFGALSAQYKDKYEPVLYCFKKKSKPQWFGPTNEVSVWDCKRASKNEFHPTQKPIELCERALNNHTLPKQNVIDLFGGSGSSLIACEKTDRKCFMMELDAHYCDTIIERWQKYSMQQAYLITSEGETLYDNMEAING